MSKSLLLYDEALNIGKKELIALKNQDIETVEILSMQRSSMLKEAWALRNTVTDNSHLRKKLLDNQNLQNELTLECQKLKNIFQKELHTTKKHHQGIKGYSQSISQTNKTSTLHRSDNKTIY